MYSKKWVGSVPIVVLRGSGVPAACRKDLLERALRNRRTDKRAYTLLKAPT